MKQTIHFRSYVVHGNLRRSCIIKLSTGDTKELYLETSCKYEERVSARNDFLLVLAVHILMEIGGLFSIEGEIDATLLRRLENYSCIWSVWCPEKYKRISLAAESPVDYSREGNNDEAIAAFSSGVDACYNLYGHEHHLFGASSQNITSAMMLHGADIPLSSEEAFDIAYANAKETLEKKGIELIAVRTNYRESTGVNWEHCFFSVVVAGLMMFSKRYAMASCGADMYISSSSIQIPWGMNYITDHLLFPSYFEVYAGRPTEDRTERCRQISHDPLLMKNLRVCWQANSNGGNCGKCEKCQRTMLNFMVIGYNGPLPFRTPFSLEHFRNSPLWDKDRQAFYRDILAYNDHISHALPDDIRQEIARHLALSSRSNYTKRKIFKRLISLVPVPSWRRKWRSRLS